MFKKLAIAAALSAVAFSSVAANCYDPSVMSAAAQKELSDQKMSTDAARAAAAQAAMDNAKGQFETQSPDLKQASCFDRYSKFSVPISFGIPSIGDLLGAITKAACAEIDKQVAQVTNKVGGVGGSLPYGLGSVKVGNGTFTGGTTGSVGGVNVKQTTSGTIADRVQQGIFR